MSRSRFLIFRSYGLGFLAAIASMIMLNIPAHAGVVVLHEPGYHISARVHVDPLMIIDQSAERFAIIPRSSDIAVRDLVDPIVPLKPEYAASYETHGLNFIDLRRRC